MIKTVLNLPEPPKKADIDIMQNPRETYDAIEKYMDELDAWVHKVYEILLNLR